MNEVNIHLEEYKCLRSEILEFQKILFRVAILFYTLIVTSLGYLITSNIENGLVLLDKLSDKYIVSILLIIPIIYFVFIIFIYTYMIEIKAASLYILQLGNKIKKSLKSNEVLFGWESVKYMPKAASIFEQMASSLMILLGLIIEISILILTFCFAIKNGLTVLYCISCLFTLSYITGSIILAITVKKFNSKEIEEVKHFRELS